MLETRRQRRRRRIKHSLLLLALAAALALAIYDHLHHNITVQCARPAAQTMGDGPRLCFSDKPEMCPPPKPPRKPKVAPNTYGPLKPFGGDQPLQGIKNDHCRQAFDGHNYCQKQT